MTAVEHAAADGRQPGGTENCLQLAMMGERLCRTGSAEKIAEGIKKLELALTCGTDDVRTLSAIYSQLGNAFFTLGQYERALEYHRHDLVLTKTFRDELGEAKACGNLANTLRAVGQYEQAIMCAQYHLKLARKLDDKSCISRALYNLGNAYHARGKHVGRLVAHANNASMGSGEQNRLSAASLNLDASNATTCTELAAAAAKGVTDEVDALLRKALQCYEENAWVAHELGDRAAEGRAWGNLGNTYYLLGEFEAAIGYHEKRLGLAKEFGDTAAIRRAYTNLANAHLFLGQLEVAINYYTLALKQAVASSDEAAEAQVCFSLGNTLALAGRPADACDYHTRHLRIARRRADKAGLARAAWSLGTAYTAQGEYRKALYFVLLHYRTSKEIGDTNGETVAESNMAELERVHSEQRQRALPAAADGGNNNAFDFMPDASADPSPVDVLAGMNLDALANRVRSIYRKRSALESTSGAGGRAVEQLRRHSADRLSAARPEDVQIGWRSEVDTRLKPLPPNRPEEDFFDFLSRMQCKRIDDQRCDAARLTGGGRGAHDERLPGARPTYRAADTLRPDICSLDAADAVSTSSEQALLGGGASTPRCRRARSASLSAARSSAVGARVDGAWRWPLAVLQRCRPAASHPLDSDPLLRLIDVSLEMDDGNLGLDGAPNAPGGAAQSPEAFVDMIVGMQARRMNDQRTELAFLPGLQRRPPQPQPHRLEPAAQRNGLAAPVVAATAAAQRQGDRGKENAQQACSSQHAGGGAAAKPKDEDFLDFVMRLQSHRIEEQRSAPPSALASRPPSSTQQRAAPPSNSVHGQLDARPSSAAHDDIINVVDRMQAGRYNDQRTMLPPACAARPSSSESQPAAAVERHRRSLSERLKRNPK